MSEANQPANFAGSRTFHTCLSVRGTLLNSTNRQLAGLFKHGDGRKATAAEVKAHLMEALSQGKEVLPFGPPCEGFDYSGGGCPGHPGESQ